MELTKEQEQVKAIMRIAAEIGCSSHTLISALEIALNEMNKGKYIKECGTMMFEELKKLNLDLSELNNAN